MDCKHFNLVPSKLPLAKANEAMLRLGNLLRDKALVKGLRNYALPAPPRATAGQATKHRQRSAKPQRRGREMVFMPASLVSTTLPHRKPSGSEFTRAYGKVQTTLVSTTRAGLPYGIYPLLILIYLATAARRSRARRSWWGAPCARCSVSWRSHPRPAPGTRRAW